MAKFLFFHKCDFCGRWVWIRLGWVYQDGKEFCSGICAEKKKNVIDFDMVNRA